MTFATFMGRSAIAAGALMLAAAPALAVTVTNQSDKAHEVVADLGMEEPTTGVEPGKSAKLDCPEGCEVRVMGSGYGISATSGEKLMIGKDGLLAYQDGKAQVEARNDKDGKAKSKTMVD